MAAAALLRVRLGPFARQKMLEGTEQEGAKLPLVAIGPPQIILREQSREEFLSQVPGVVEIITFPENVRVERIPVGAAELLQSLVSLSRFRLATRQHDAPMGREEPTCLSL